MRTGMRCLLCVVVVCYLAQHAPSSAYASTLCPPFTVEYDKTTLTSYVKFVDGGMFGPLQADPRVPLLNFQYAFPQCFADVEFAAPLVSGTMSGVSGASGGSTLVLPYSRNPPPNRDYCQAEDLMGPTYCNDFATLVIGDTCDDLDVDQADLVTPTHPTLCSPPLCYPCASDPTGLGVSAAQIGSCYFDERTGRSLKLFACYPNLGCTSHQDCAVNADIINSADLQPTPYGPLLLSVTGQPIRNNSLNENPFFGFPCCSYDPNFPVCGFQNVRCDCQWCGGAIGYPLWSYTFENTNRKTANNAQYSKNTPDAFCTNSVNPTAFLFYISPSKAQWKSGDVMRYQVTRTVRGVDFAVASSQATITEGRTTPNGATPDFNTCENPANGPPYRCVSVFDDKNYAGDTVAVCTTLSGGEGAWGRLESAIRQKNLQGDPWWGGSNWQGGKVGNWNADIKSFTIGQCTRATFYQNTRFRGDAVTVTASTGEGCRCSDISSTSGCCPGIKFSTSSLIVQKIC